MGSQVKPSICHCEKPLKTNMENQILDGLGRCFSSEQGLFFRGVRDPAPLCRGGLQGLDRCEKHLHTRSLRRKTQKTNTREGGNFWAYFFGVETQNSQWFFSVLKWRTFFEGDVLLRCSLILICAYHGRLECLYCKWWDWVRPLQFFLGCVLFNKMVGNINSACTCFDVEKILKQILSALQNRLQKSADLGSIMRLTPHFQGIFITKPLDWQMKHVFRVILE